MTSPMVVYRTVLSEKSPVFTQVPKVFRSKRQRTYIKEQNISYYLAQKTDPKGEKQQYSLDSVNKRRLVLFTFSLGSEYCSFRGKHVLFHRQN